MKKTIILLTAILFALQMQAQDAMLLNRIREVNGKVKSFESDLANTMVKPKKTTSQNGKDYAIISSEAQGEMPVNFKAKENGTYTLSINVEGMEMNYLHLIDNKTGNDVDLLQTPSYSFEAKTTDYESRFKLVFVANNEDSVSAGSETFAFFSNGSFVINNPSTGSGPATLQVIDITGRIVKSESINGCANVNVNAAPGVYMLRLINGDNVKTQKVVVK